MLNDSPTPDSGSHGACSSLLAQLTSVSASGLRPGSYGLHVHAAGRCEGDFTSAGPHWNPTMRQHGSQNPQGPHRGDLPNLIVGANGQGEIAFTIPDARVSGGVGGTSDLEAIAEAFHPYAAKAARLEGVIETLTQSLNVENGTSLNAGVHSMASTRGRVAP